MTDTSTDTVPTSAPPEQTPYDALGGDAGIHRLVDRFYELMSTRPEAATIRAMHPKNIQSSNDKLYEFLSGWLGGPPLYMQRRGHPRLRRRHMPFPIDQDAADQWMACMEIALGEVEISPLQRNFLLQRLRQVADFMRNQP